jgi:hypothetical protein
MLQHDGPAVAVMLKHNLRRSEKSPIFATLYHNLGVNLDSERLFDFRGRPQYLVEPVVKPIAELS